MKKIVVVFLLVIGFICFNTYETSAQETTYKVKAGDCLWSIAIKHGVTVNYLKQINNLTSDFLQIGDVLKLSLNTTSTTTSPPPNLAVDSTPSRGGNAVGAEYHEVKPGDSLYQIALDNNTSVTTLKMINNLSSDAIYVGQKLLLPRSTTPSEPDTMSTGELIISKAAEHLGTPYRYGGESPGGFDCSGFVRYIFKQFGYNLPHNAAAQANLGTPVAKSDLKTGDLVFFGSSSYIDHVGIYSDNGRFIHSSSPRSGGVIYSSLSENYYARTYVTARRILQ